jgi:hypothetical protein
MSEQWLGLHNEQWHQGYSLALNATRCENPRRGACFDEWCAPDKPCRCCLAAEVDNLRAQLIALLAPEDPTYEELSARVQAVRAVADSTLTVDDQPGVRRGWDEAMSCVLRALDGGDE